MLKKIALICLAAATLAGCGSSSSSKPAANQTINLTRAAYVSGGSPGNKIVMTMQETAPGVGQISINGNGTFSGASHQGEMTMRMGLPAAAAAQLGGVALQMQVVIDKGTIYMKLPAQLASKIPGGKPWWKINLNGVGKLAGVPGLGSLMSGTSNLSDPGQYLNFLRATTTGSVKSLGTDTVNGVQTTHYQAQIDFAKLPNAVPARERAVVEQFVAALQKKGAAPRALPINAWIDSKNLIRRLRFAFAQPLPNGQSANVSMNMDYLDYGPQPAPTVPPASQTLDLLKLLGR